MEVINWREEVRLNNGNLIIVNRQESFSRAYDGNSIGRMLQDEELNFQVGLKKKIEWRDRRMSAISIDEDVEGNFYIVANFENDAARRDYPVKVGFHVAFKYTEDGTWKIIPINEVPEFMKANLLINPADRFIRDKKPMSEIISMDIKEKVNSSDASFDRFYNFQKHKLGDQ